MDLIQLIILALIQGVTEFLPVSSSAHLILVPLLTGWRDQGLSIDVAAHFGSLFAVIVYFRKDITRILFAGMSSVVSQRMESSDSKLFWYVVIASLPALISGFVFHNIISMYFREPLIIALASIGFGLLLWYADVRGKRVREINSINLRDAVFIGFAQMLALIPGTSRSGITMTVALLLGMNRNSAAKFSFLMAVPVIFVAGIYEAYQLFQTSAIINISHFVFTVILSAVSALLTIHYFLKFLDKVGMLPFVIYRILLGLVLIILFIRI